VRKKIRAMEKVHSRPRFYGVFGGGYCCPSLSHFLTAAIIEFNQSEENLSNIVK